MMKRQYLNVFAKQQQNIKKYLSRLAPLAFFYITIPCGACQKILQGGCLISDRGKTITGINGDCKEFIFCRRKTLSVRACADDSIGNNDVGNSVAE